MNQELNITWNKNMHFVSRMGNYSVNMDSVPDFGGEDQGVGPKALLLAALGGCTGMDVISILKKMDITPEYFNIKIEAKAADEHPKRYLEMHVIYEIKGNNLDFEKIEKAVKLSQYKYCGVKATFEGSVKMSYEIQIL
jgi:putative redox protein